MKPYVLFNAAMTIDGKIASKTGDTQISDEQDWREVHKIRKISDAIMVGIVTVLKDNPKLTIKYFNEDEIDKFPIRIVIDSKCRTPLNSNVLTFKPEKYKTIIATTSQSSIINRQQLENEGAKVIIVNEGDSVDLTKLMTILFQEYKIKRLMLEGGGCLAWGMLSNDLIDELRVFITPHLCGGKGATSIITGEGFEKIQKAPMFKLKNVDQRDDYIILTYLRSKHTVS